MRKILAFFLVLLMVYPAMGQGKYPPVEKLVYSGYYNWGIIWVKAGQIEFSLSKSEKYDGADKLLAVGGTLPSWDWFFTIRDTLISHYNPSTFLPYEFSRRAHEGSYHKIFNYSFDYRDSVIHSDVHRIGKYRNLDTLPLKSNTFDMLSVAWMARDLDFEHMHKNQEIPVRILIDCKTYDLYVRYLGVEKTKISGRKRECYVFSPLLLEGQVFKGGENMKVWVSRDELRLPLMVEAKILVGSVKAILDMAEVRTEDVK